MLQADMVFKGGVLVGAVVTDKYYMLSSGTQFKDTWTIKLPSNNKTYGPYTYYIYTNY